MYFKVADFTLFELLLNFFNVNKIVNEVNALSSRDSAGRPGGLHVIDNCCTLRDA